MRKCEAQAQLLTGSRPDSQTITWAKPLRKKGEVKERSREKNDNDSGRDWNCLYVASVVMYLDGAIYEKDTVPLA